MRLGRRAALAMLLVSTAGDARAQGAVDPSAPLPAGHPGPGAEPPQDRVAPAPDLRPGTLEVHVRDGSDAVLPSVPLRLGILHNDVATGDSKTEREATTDDQGKVVFQGLEIGTSYSYRVTVPRGAASFASEPVRLDPSGGQRVLLHVYPVVRDLREALIGMRAVVFVQPREDVFHVEENFQILNIGAVAWVPDAVRLALPPGAKAFRPGDSMSDKRFDRTPNGDVELYGTFGPGQSEIGFQFQLDNPHDRQKALGLTLPPHVAELRVVAEGSRGMTLHVEGFPDAEPMQGQDGSRLLVTGRHLTRGDPALATVDILLENLPVPSQGRWYAVALAIGLAGLGLGRNLTGRSSSGARGLTAEEAAEAESLVLSELVSLDRLRRDDRIGPRTYEETHRELLDALVRLDLRSTPKSG